MKIMVGNWEQSVIRRAQAGDPSAIETLVESYRPAVRSHAMRMLRDVEDANDAAQETFVKAIRGLKSFDDSRPLLPWLIRICTNCSLDLIRSRRHRAENIDKYEFSICDTTVDLERGAEAGEDSRAVQSAITRLPERYREIIVMRHYRHMEVNEIAHALNKPEGTVKSWLFRARAHLKKDLTIALGV